MFTVSDPSHDTVAVAVRCGKCFRSEDYKAPGDFFRVPVNCPECCGEPMHFHFEPLLPDDPFGDIDD